MSYITLDPVRLIFWVTIITSMFRQRRQNMSVKFLNLGPRLGDRRVKEGEKILIFIIEIGL